MKSWLLTGLSFGAFFLSSLGLAKTVRYRLVVEQKSVNLSGKKTIDFALVVNGGIPAPVLEFTEGDDAEITVENRVPGREDVSIHWHGILLPPGEDGVPFVNTPPIYFGESRTFKFKLRQSGTYWYHSHTMLQEQKGVYGAIVIHPKKNQVHADREAVVVLSDWSDEDADQILRNLKKDGDYYLYKKGTLRSYWGALENKKLGNQFKNEWTRMGGMDLSDVGYDAFLINGQRDSQLLKLGVGETVRLRIINAASSTYFHVSLGGLPLKVIAADGVDIQPIRAHELLMGMAETYDVLFTLPDKKNYELRATAQDGTGQASAWLGEGEKVPAKPVPAPDLYAAMDHSDGGHGHGSHSSHGADLASHSEHSSLELLTVDHLKALTPMSSPPQGAPIHDLKLVLNGDMRRYVWHINGKLISEDRFITVNPGEVMRITYQNESMMHHPMHLHGHFFRVLNGNREFSPVKHTVDVQPMSSRTIEVVMDEVGQWMLHCHNLFHMDSGMARVVKYSNYSLSPEMASHEKHDHHLHDPWYTYGKAEIASNHAEGNFRVSQSWNEFQARIESANIRGKNFSFNDAWDYEGDLFYKRWLNNWTHLIAGGTAYGKAFHGMGGIGYTLPLLLESAVLVDHSGNFRVDLERKFQWTKLLFTEVELTWRPGQPGGAHRAEFEISLMAAPTWAWAAGLMLTNDSLGGGIEFQF